MSVKCEYERKKESIILRKGKNHLNVFRMRKNSELCVAYYKHSFSCVDSERENIKYVQQILKAVSTSKRRKPNRWNEFFTCGKLSFLLSSLKLEDHKLNCLHNILHFHSPPAMPSCQSSCYFAAFWWHFSHHRRQPLRFWADDEALRCALRAMTQAARVIAYRHSQQPSVYFLLSNR